MSSQKHGMSKTRFYRTWKAMRARCLNSLSQDYQSYGGRGIKVCERWQEFENFRDDMYQSYLIHFSKFKEGNTTLERINNDGNYEPTNCEWATWKEQANNKRVYRIDKYLIDYSTRKDHIAEFYKKQHQKLNMEQTTWAEMGQILKKMRETKEPLKRARVELIKILYRLNFQNKMIIRIMRCKNKEIKQAMVF